MKPRDPTLSTGCAGAVDSGPMTSISVSEHQPPTVPLLQQQQTRRHIERPIRVWPFAMECLAETDTETDTAETTTDGRLGDSNSTQQQPTSAAKKDGTNSHIKKSAGNNQQQQQQQRQQSLDGTKKIVEAESVGCAPFFGVKHYLNNFYGIPDDDTSSKIWRQIEAVSSPATVFLFSLC